MPTPSIPDWESMNFAEGDTIEAIEKQNAQNEALQTFSTDLVQYVEESAEALLTAGGKIFPTVAEGLAAAEDDGYFYAENPDPNISKTLYQRISASESRKVADDPSLESINQINDETQNYRSAGDPLAVADSDVYSYMITDEQGRVALGIKQDGVLDVPGVSVEGGDIEQDSGELGDDYAWVIRDDLGRVAVAIKNDGTFVYSGSESAHIQRQQGLYTHQLNFLINTGQSLGEGSDGVITTAQEFDNVGFPARSVSPTEYLPLTVDNTQVGTRGESPMYGTLGNIKTLIQNEAGIDYQDNDYQLLTANNCNGGTPIADLSKGGATGSFEQGISQVQSGHDIAQQEGRSFSLQAVTWTQGERDIVDGTSRQTYLDALLQLHADYDTDAKAITGQFNDVKLISYQTCRIGAESTVASAQLAASEINPHILIATPTYQLSFYDFQHIDAASSKWLGGYYGLVYKRVVIDKEDWEPLKPKRHMFSGSVIDLFFNKSGLVFDTSIGAQTNQGFSVVDDNGSALTVNSVEIINPDRVRITTNQPIGLGYKVRYGWNSAINRADSFTGCCGNLRDSAGDYLQYNGNPLHNWCVIFEYEV